MEELKRLSTELGNPGAAVLFTAARRRQLDVSRAQVQAFVKSNSAKQVLGAPQRAQGKSFSEEDNRWMMDLIDVTKVPAGYWKFFLVAVNVLDRYLYARPLSSKEPKVVVKALKEILDQSEGDNRKRPTFISSDSGTEFRNDEVKNFLARKGIVQKFKDAGDLNALGLLDRSIGLLKRRLAELHAENKKSWAVNLQSAVAALNKTPKPEVLHGAAPAEVRSDPEVKFMLLQDQARALQHNMKLNKERERELARTGGTFRPQLELTKFKRNYQATYGDPKTAQRVEAGRVHTAGGESYPLKRVRVVPAGSSAVVTGRENQKMKNGGSAILAALARVLEGGEAMSLNRASRGMREDMAANGQSYDAVLKAVGGRLIDLIRLSPDQFQLVERAHGKQTWYYVRLA